MGPGVLPGPRFLSLGYVYRTPIANRTLSPPPLHYFLYITLPVLSLQIKHEHVGNVVSDLNYSRKHTEPLLGRSVPRFGYVFNCYLVGKPLLRVSPYVGKAL